MFESAETEKEWLTDVECLLRDLQAEIRNNPFGIQLKNVDYLIEQSLKDISNGG